MKIFLVLFILIGFIACSDSKEEEEKSEPYFIDNLSLDVWIDHDNYEVPEGFSSSNELVTLFGTPHVFKIEGMDNGYAARLISIPFSMTGIGVATIFTGTTSINIANPAASVDLGVAINDESSNKSFTGMEFYYRFNAGDSMFIFPTANDKQYLRNEIDACVASLQLQRREGGKIYRVATGSFSTDSETDDWTKAEVTLIYGEITHPTVGGALRTGEEWGDAGMQPTHISLHFTSSAGSDEFKGAFGSTFDIDDITLISQ